MRTSDRNTQVYPKNTWTLKATRQPNDVEITKKLSVHYFSTDYAFKTFTKDNWFKFQLLQQGVIHYGRNGIEWIVTQTL